MLLSSAIIDNRQLSVAKKMRLIAIDCNSNLYDPAGQTSIQPKLMRKKNQLKNQKTTLIYLFHDSEKLNWKYILGLGVSRIIE